MINKHFDFQRENPVPYEGTVTYCGNEYSIVDRANELELDRIIDRVGIWVLTERGIESLTHTYHIARGRYYTEDWENDLSRKPSTFEYDNFISIFQKAKSLFSEIK